jgi:alpha-ketoglutarate-dependent taurine dioxygenase
VSISARAEARQAPVFVATQLKVNQMIRRPAAGDRIEDLAMSSEAKRTGQMRFRSTRPQAVTTTLREEWIKTGRIESGGPLPLVVEPKVEGIDLVYWVKEHRDFIEANLLKHGGILFRHFDINGEAEFERFARAISPQLVDYEDQHTPRTRLNGSVYTSTEYPADHYIPFHSENSKNSTWPMKLWFFCVKPADQGGATPIADNRKVFQLIPPKIRERFIEKRVMYVRNFGEGAGLPWQAVFQTSDRSVVEEYCRRNSMDFVWRDGNRLRLSHVCQSVARHPRTGEMIWFNQAHLFHISGLAPAVRESLLSLFDEAGLPSNAYYGDGSRIEDAVIQEVREAYDEAAVRFPWQPKDILMLENMLVAHGREPYSGTRKILVAMAEASTATDF